MERMFRLDVPDFYIDTPERVEIVKSLAGKRIEAEGFAEGDDAGKQLVLIDAVMEFSRIRKDLDVKSFASKYGLLGLGDSGDISDIASYSESFDIDPLSTSELIEEWLYHADRFRKLLKLRRAYKENHQLNKIISVSGPTFCWKEDNAPMLLPCKKFRVETWNDGESIKLTYDTNIDEIGAGNNDLLRQITPILIKDEIEPFLRSPLITVHFDSTDVVFADKEKRFQGGDFHFVLREKKVTLSLLVAMYYELFKLVNGDGNIGICDVCGGPVLIKRSRGAGPCYCSTKCKVKKHSKGGKTDG